MSRRLRSSPRFAVCIKSDDAGLLTPRKIYRLLPDAAASESKYVRVVDDEGDDYLYPAEFFMVVELPQEVERALVDAA